jgi:hypothetical protein
MRFGMQEEAADVRGRSYYLVQIGYLSLNTVEDMDTRMKRIPQYIKMFTDAEPTQRELERFFSRIGYVEP